MSRKKLSLLPLCAVLALCGCSKSAESAPTWPNPDVSRTATSGTVDQCHSEAEASTYLGAYKVETTCGGGASAVVTVDDVWFESEVSRPLVIDTQVPEAYPGLLGTVSVTEGAEFWQNAYFYAQCPSVECPGAPIGCHRVPPGGIAFDLPGTDPGTAWISCYAGLGTDAGEEEACIAFGNDGSINQAGCSLSARPN